MIVKRVTEALRRQDWAVVTIEFVLVVVGVLFAFQINEWANEREAREERRLATERLLDEAEQNVAYLRLGVSAQEQLVDDLNFALSRIQQGSWRPAEEERMTSGMSWVRSMVPLAPPSSVYEDLVASGAFGKIGDAELRSSIAKYRATLGFYGRVLDYQTGNRPNFEDFAAFRFVFSPDGRQRVRLEVDFPGLRDDRLLQEKLALLADDQRVLLLLRQRALKGAARMCIKLGRFVGQRCNLNLPPPTFD